MSGECQACRLVRAQMALKCISVYHAADAMRSVTCCCSGEIDHRAHVTMVKRRHAIADPSNNNRKGTIAHFGSFPAILRLATVTAT